jgi:YggT family protein
MQSFLSLYDSALGVLRNFLLGAAVLLFTIAELDSLVRSRKISPFGSIGRFMRGTIDPLLKPVERRVVRAGGLPANAPWWALGALVLAGILLLALLGFIRSEMAFLYSSLTGGPAGLYRLLVTLVFTVLQIALLVRVVLSWIAMRPGAWYWRWSYALTEPLLKPLRKIIPPIGMMDITPIVAWFLLGLIQSALLWLA